MSAPVTRDQWRKTLADLPATPNRIPAIFLAHGQPLLVWPKNLAPPEGRMGGLWEWSGRDGPLGQFLDDLGPVLMEKYKPKGIIVFSAHWETDGERLVTDYGDENPLLMDYYGFIPELYKLEFHSRGDSALTAKIVDAFKKAGQPARPTTPKENRGQDGRGYPGPGFDHGVFVPFKRLFGDNPTTPIVEVSIDESLTPQKHWAIGKALNDLRSEGYLIIAGGLVVHTFANNLEGFDVKTAKPVLKEFHKAITEAVQVQDVDARRKALEDLTHHPGFRIAHPREEHFIPLYVAAGAGEAGESRVLADIYGQSTFAFGI